MLVSDVGAPYRILIKCEMPARRETDEMQLIRISEEEKKKGAAASIRRHVSQHDHEFPSPHPSQSERVEGRSAGGAGRARTAVGGGSSETGTN